MNLRQRQQLLSLLAGAAVVVFAADRLVITPLAAGWKDRAVRIERLKQSVNQGAILLERQDAIQSRWNGMRARALPAQYSAAEDLLLKSFDRWAKESGASIGSIRPQSKSGDPDYILLECRADATGNLGALARFLYELENDPLPIKVDRLEMTATDNNGQQLSLTLQVSALLLNPEERP